MKKGSFLLLVLSLALPNIIQSFVINLSEMVDNLMVGRLNEHAISGVSITNQVFFVFTTMTFALGAIGGIFITQYHGAKKYNEITEVYRVAMLFALGLGIIFFLTMQFQPTLILHLLAKEEKTIEQALIYVSYIKYTFLIFPLSMVTAASFRYIGRVKLPMFVSIFVLSISIFLNFGLVHGNMGFPAMGVAGAGLSTLIARIIEISIYFILSAKLATPIKYSLFKMFKFKSNILYNYFSKGNGLFANELMWGLGMQILSVSYTQRISENIASYSIANVLMNLTFIGMGGMSVAVSIIIGNHLGKNEFEEAKIKSKKLMKIAAGIGATMGIISFITSFALFKLYTVPDIILFKARMILLVVACFSFLYYLNASIFFVIRSGGDTKSVLLMDSGFLWAVSIPFAIWTGTWGLFLPIHYLLVQFIDFLKLTVALFRYKRYRWLVNLAEDPQINQDTKLVSETN